LVWVEPSSFSIPASRTPDPEAGTHRFEKIASMVDVSPSVSISDARSYKYIELENGLRVLLIHDAGIKKSDSSKAGSCQATDARSVESRSSDDESCSGSGSADDDGSDDSEHGSDPGSEEMEEDGVGEAASPRSAPMVETKRAAAALSVGVGHFSDPDELPGLSHYLEHMLFMGSEKYPDENDYDAFLTQHNGSSNAFTEEEATTYHFECAPHAFEAALDRFAQFFIAPLMKPDALDREVLAVDSEFSGVLQNDSCRLAQVRAVSGPVPSDHPAAKFGWGNRKSLKDDPAERGIAVRDYLLGHYREHYRADRMNLVIICGETLDEMESWVRLRFSSVPGSRGSRARFNHLPMCRGGSNFGIIPSSRSQHKVSISFHLPSWLEACYGKKAEEYVSHLVGHEGKGSLLALLKEREWATDLCAGVAEQTSAFWLFEITVTLTDKGLDAGPGCGLAAVQAVFGYLDMLRGAPPQRWIWDEMESIAKIKWDYIDEEDPSDYVSQISGDLHVVPVKHALNWSYLHEEFDADLILRLLSEYMVPDHAQIHLQSNEYDAQVAKARGMLDTSLITSLAEAHEPWFDFDFLEGSMDVSKAIEPGIRAFQTSFHLPKKNPYIATNFELLCGVGNGASAGNRLEAAVANGVGGVDGVGRNPGNAAYPRRLGPQHAFHPTYHLMDDKFRLPKLATFFRFTRGETGGASPREVALIHLIIKLMEDILCEEAYLADTAGLHYSIYMDGCSSIDFRIEGFNDKIAELISLVFQSFATIETALKDDVFHRVKESVFRHYQNALMKPIKHASFLRLQTLKHHHEDPRDVTQEIQSITADDVRRFVSQMRTVGRLTSLIVGNCTETTAMDLAKAAVDCIGCNPWEAPPVQSVLDMQPGQAIMRRETVFNKKEGNSCIEYYLQIGLAADVERRAMLDLVDQLLYEPCYNTLRTKQQLGYIVSSGTRLTHGVLGLCITIQSKTHSATSMEARIDEFLTTHLQMLRDMSDDEYGKNVNALIEHKRIKAMSISEQGERLWDSLLHRDGAFDHREADISVIETISKSEVISFYAQEIAPGGDKVRKLIVCVEREPVDAAPDAPDAPDPANPRLLHADDLSRFHEDNKSVRDDAFLRI